MSQDSKQQKGRQTDYSNKIGLYSNQQDCFVDQINDVVINFPFKDCVLEGGMTKEDGKSREERFLLHKTDAADIDALLDEKVLTNFKLINNQGERQLAAQDNIDFFDEDGELKQNLLIKGNNLLALHTLKSKLAGKVKLVYIDPPYNTGNDSFNYNDNFNHSTWLVFMKNRLEVARQLLRDDGVIFVHLDFNEIHYCKILMDEIFGRENFVNEIIWRRKQATSYGNSKFGITNDTILFYSKSENYTFYPIYSIDDENTKNYIKERFVNDDGDGRKYMKSPLVNSLYRPNLKYIFQGINPPPNGWLYSQERMKKLFENKELIIPCSSDARIYRKIYLDTYKGQVIQNIWTDIPIVNPMAKEQTEFSTQKPEKLLERIIQSVTQENDIILDYHLGSATTCAVAHKMNRRWIGIEQMDYIEDIAKVRLQKVIEGEQGGISKAVNWTGGGSFIYLELKKYNQEYVEQISQANTKDELKEIYIQMQQNAFLQFWFDKKDFEIEENYIALNLDEQKIKLLEILDENQLYLNKADMNDSKHNVSEVEREFTERFYGE